FLHHWTVIRTLKQRRRFFGFVRNPTDNSVSQLSDVEQRKGGTLAEKAIHGESGTLRFPLMPNNYRNINNRESV
ncbi:hypothetical protein SEEE1831_18435, partial [Salmonella enterica subsp. enterica serovar Enteritidis str. 13183-1]